jgi:AbiV family abortive infection protein
MKEKENNTIKLTKDQFGQLYDKCVLNAANLLEAADILLQNTKTQQYSLGLYMYALEEFGKSQLIKKYFEENEEIPKWIFGRRDPQIKDSHKRKIEFGLLKLPHVCNELSLTLELSYNSSDKARMINLEKGNDNNNSISVPPYQTGLFTDITNGPAKIVESDLKTSCFYIDWEERNKNPKFILSLKEVASQKQLKYNIKRFRESLDSFYD